LQGVATGEISQVATSLLAEGRLELAFVGGSCGSDGQVAAGGGVTLASSVVGVVAFVDGILKGSGVPAVLEVGVEGETARVTGSPDEWPAAGFGPLRSKVLNVPGDFIEQLHEVNGVGVRANAVVEAVKVCSMGGMGR